MINRILDILTREEKILTDLVLMTEYQNRALVEYKTSNIPEIIFKQDYLLGQLSKIEQERIELFIEIFKISRVEAVNLKLSMIENKLKGDSKVKVHSLRTSISKLNNKLIQLNNENRILANRGKQSINNIIRTLNQNNNAVFNVKI
jgi:flagellar biosynthesis/type III secretory pathway chaperone